MKMYYKYKPLSSIEDLDRILDIINNLHLYLPTYKQLNDPLEGAGFNIHISGRAGNSLSLIADTELPELESAKLKYRILSLSTKYDSPQLWAHYANNYEGVCLCFAFNNTEKWIRKVEYGDERMPVYASTNEEIEDAVYEGFFFKQSGWSYEEEWRYVKKVEEMKEFGSDSFLPLHDGELKGIIVGNRLSRGIFDLFLDEVSTKIPVMKARPGYTNHKIIILPGQYNDALDGRQPPVIDDVCDYLLNDENRQ